MKTLLKDGDWQQVPRELSIIPRWVVWKWEERDGKPTKPPYNAKTGTKASSTDPSSWCEFAEALTAYRDGPYDGIGLVVTDDDDLVGVDLDHCVNPETGAVEGWAQASSLSSAELARRFEDAGVAAIIFTDIARDGMLQGANVAATAELARTVSIPVIASGGVSGVNDVRLLRESDAPIAGVVIGRALYDGRIDAAEALAAARGAD